MAGDKITATDYITHHLQSLTSLSDVAKGQGLDNIADFSFINIDAIFFSVLLGESAVSYFCVEPRRRQQVYPVVFRLLSRFCLNLWMICVKALFTTNNPEKPLLRWA